MNVADLATVVTGGASGLGAATATMLAGAGARVAIIDIAEEAGERLARRIGGLFCRADVTSETDVCGALDTAAAHHGIARILVNCAGVAPSIMTVRPERPHAVDAFRYTIDTNLVGTFITLSRFAHRLMHAESIGEENGVIINTASIAAYDGHVGHAAYAASKAGIVGMTLPLARELCQYRIRAMTIAPGLFATPMLDDVPGSDRVGLATQVPHPARLGHASEFAKLVVDIIANPMLNGEVIRLDGALRLGPR